MVVNCVDIHLQKLVTDALMVLCKSRLPYAQQFKIEGLLAITIDSKEVVIVNVNNTTTSKNDEKLSIYQTSSNDCLTSSNVVSVNPQLSTCSISDNKSHILTSSSIQNDINCIKVDNKSCLSKSDISRAIPKEHTYSIPSNLNVASTHRTPIPTEHTYSIPFTNPVDKKTDENKIKLDTVSSKNYKSIKSKTDHNYSQSVGVHSSSESTKMQSILKQTTVLNLLEETKENSNIVPIKKTMDLTTRNYVTNSICQFKAFLRKQGIETDQIFDIEPKEMDILIARWIWALKNKSGHELNYKVLKLYQKGLQQYLLDNDYAYDISEHEYFKSSQGALSTKLSMLKKVFPKKKCIRRECDTLGVLSEEEKNALWENGSFGSQSGTSLLTTVYWIISKTFGLKSMAEHRDLLWGDILIKVDDANRECLVCSEHLLKKKSTSFRKKLQHLPGVHNEEYLSIMKEYTHRRPSLMNTISSPFYLQVKLNSNIGKPNVWFKRTPLGFKSFKKLETGLLENIAKIRQVHGHNLKIENDFSDNVICIKPEPE